MLESLGWNHHFERAWREAGARGKAARVVSQRRGQHRVSDGTLERWAHIRGRPRGANAPAVGDWVAVGEAGGDKAVIEAILPRHTRLSRKATGVPQEQVVAANVDIVFVVAGLDGEFNPRKVERHLVAAWQGGAKPIVLLNKADLAVELAGAMVEAKAVAGQTTPVLATSARTEAGLHVVREALPARKTAVFLGASGVGKSSIINALLGEDKLRVGEVREADGKGRHTTTHRELLSLPHGGLVIDTPGIREIQPWIAREGLQRVFPLIAELSEQCRYRDCRHVTEDRCAILAAIDEGALDPSRVERHRELFDEALELEREVGP